MANGHGGRRKGSGRKAGSTNATSKLLKDAVIEAAEAVGDEKGKDGLVGYLTARAKDQPVAFMGLIGRVIPLQIEGSGEDGAITVKISK